MIQVKKFEQNGVDHVNPLKPIFENVSNKFGNNVNFSYIDIDDSLKKAQKHHVRSVPTVIIEKDGQELNRFVGVQSELTYTNFALNEISS